MKGTLIVAGVEIHIGKGDPPFVMKSAKGPVSRISRRSEFSGRKRERRDDCIHLIGPTEDNVAITKPKGCGGCSQTETRIWLCDKYDDCAPFALGIINDPTVRDCRNCGDYESKSDPKSSEEV